MAEPTKDMSMTSFMDGMFAGLEKDTGLKPSEWSTRFGPELLGAGVETAGDIFLTPLMTKILGLVLGLPSIGAAAFAPKDAINSRLRSELFTFGMHEVTRLLDPTPADVLAIRKNINDICVAITGKEYGLDVAPEVRGKRALGAFVRDLKEWEDAAKELSKPLPAFMTSSFAAASPQTRTSTESPTLGTQEIAPSAQQKLASAI